MIYTINAEVMKILFFFSIFCLVALYFHVFIYFSLQSSIFIYRIYSSLCFHVYFLKILQNYIYILFFNDTPMTPYNNAWNKRTTAFLVLLDQF